MEFAINTFQWLVQISSRSDFNIWSYLLLAVLPLLVFSLKPRHPSWLRIGRLVLAIGLGYIMINLWLVVGHEIASRYYDNCIVTSGFPVDSPEAFQSCENENTNSGPDYVFYAILGWLPVLSYVGIWERLWYSIYRNKIKQLGILYKGRWFSNFILILSIPVWIYIVILTAMFLFLI